MHIAFLSDKIADNGRSVTCSGDCVHETGYPGRARHTKLEFITRL